VEVEQVDIERGVVGMWLVFKHHI